MATEVELCDRTKTKGPISEIKLGLANWRDGQRHCPAKSCQSGIVPRLEAPDSANQRRASATMTDCGPAPGVPSNSTDVSSAVSDPAHDPSDRRLKDTWVPGGRTLSTVPFFGSAAAATFCSSTNFAAHSGQRVFWNLSNRCARYLSTVNSWNSCWCPHALAINGVPIILPEGFVIISLVRAGQSGMHHLKWQGSGGSYSSRA